ncbi:MAG: hypothetical protein JWM09_259 [Francisellaceae bacterium]|nr:hypothetical protein [Francisellaceae bacterium]
MSDYPSSIQIIDDNGYALADFYPHEPWIYYISSQSKYSLWLIEECEGADYFSEKYPFITHQQKRIWNNRNPIPMFNRLNNNPPNFITSRLTPVDKSFDRAWLYVFLNDYLWREICLENIDQTIYMREVNLLTCFGQDNRDAAREEKTELTLILEDQDKNPLNIKTAVSSEQWSWDYIERLGGMDPLDPRIEFLGLTLVKSVNFNSKLQNIRLRPIKVKRLINHQYEIIIEEAISMAQNRKQIYFKALNTADLILLSENNSILENLYEQQVKYINYLDEEIESGLYLALLDKYYNKKNAMAPAFETLMHLLEGIELPVSHPKLDDKDFILRLFNAHPSLSTYSIYQVLFENITDLPVLKIWQLIKLEKILKDLLLVIQKYPVEDIANSPLKCAHPKLPIERLINAIQTIKYPQKEAFSDNVVPIF